MTQRAFLDVDTQVDFVEPGGKLYAAGAEAIKPNLGRLVQFAREAGAPLIACVDKHPADDPEFADWPPHALEGTPGQAKVSESQSEGMCFVSSAPQAPEELPPASAHVVLEKQSFSVFTNPNAEAVFSRTGAEVFYVFGVVTEVCVKQAAEGLLERGYKVRLVEDAIWPLDPAQGELVLKALVEQGAERVTTAEVLAEVAPRV